ncbi:MAG: NUDIX hydrolase [Gammaproteobacteria bacterium]|nr:MAG: NUDIX hydrolase [Gammaproteobacteria bacterium]
MPWTYEHPHPAVAADVALFRDRAGRTEILLVKRGKPPFAGRWALPGGFVGIDEDLEAAARRELSEETGLQAGDLMQLQAFGRPDRDPRERVISIVFLGWLEAGDEGEPPRAGDDAADARWFPVDALPELAFDHAEIIALARQRLATLHALGGRA